MTEQREYLVALDVRSTLHAWIAAASEDDAARKAEDLYGEDDICFTAKGGGTTATVLDSRAVTPRRTRRFRIGIAQTPVHSIIVTADTLDAAIEKAKIAFLDECDFFPEDPPAGWQRHFTDWEIVEAEEVRE